MTAYAFWNNTFRGKQIQLDHEPLEKYRKALTEFVNCLKKRFPEKIPYSKYLLLPLFRSSGAVCL